MSKYELYLNRRTIETLIEIKSASEDQDSKKISASQRLCGITPTKPKLKADKENGVIYIDSNTTLSGIPEIAWEYKLGKRSALEWILDQYKAKKSKDKTIAEKFNNCRFADYKQQVIELLQRVCSVSVKTLEIIGKMETDTDVPNLTTCFVL